MADRKNQFEHTGGTGLGTVLLVRAGDTYHLAHPGEVGAGEIVVGRGTCWNNDQHSFEETGRTLLDRAGIDENGRKRW